MNIGVCAPRTWMRVTPGMSSKLTARTSFRLSAIADAPNAHTTSTIETQAEGRVMPTVFARRITGGQLSTLVSFRSGRACLRGLDRLFAPKRAVKELAEPDRLHWDSHVGLPDVRHTTPRGAGGVPGGPYGRDDPGQVPDRVPARRRRHGGGLHGGAPDAAPRDRAQDPAQALRRRQGARIPVRARGARDRGCRRDGVRRRSRRRHHR